MVSNEIVDIEPLHVAAYIEQLTGRLAKPSVKQHLAAIRMLFDWLVVGQVMATNPAAPVRGPKYTVKKGKTPVLSPDEARELLDSIDVSTVVGLRDRALIATMIYTFGRVGAVGSACMKKAASGMRCRAITIWRRISTPTSTPRVSPTILRGTCFAARVVRRAV
jgi:site-specific recombinase XerD